MAGRIPESFINDLLARVDIVEVIGARVELKRAGKELKGLSPFTGEKSPSFFVNPAKQMFFDFSSGKHGNAIGFLMEFERLGFVDAVEELARMAGVEVPREAGAGPSAAVLAGPLDALAAAQRIYRAQLEAHPQAIDYLRRRGVSGELARQFAIGFAPDAWDTLARRFKDPKHALVAGLLVERDTGGVYDRFRNRVMFPIRDARGRTVAFGGRTLGDDPAKYLNSPETPVFHKGRHLYGLYECRQANAELDCLLVVEGYMDVVSLFGHGICQAVAAMGTAFTEEQLKLLFRATRQVVFCFDGDAAGRRAARKALDLVLPQMRGDREVRFLFLPEGHDPDTLVRELGAEGFRERLKSATPLSDFLIETITQGLQLQAIDGRARLVEKARPLLRSMPPGALRSLLVERLAKLSGLAAAAVEAGGPAPVAPRRERANPAQGREDEGAPGGQRPVRRALQLLLEAPAMADRVEHQAQLLTLDLPGLPLLLEVVDYFQSHPEASVAQLIQQFDGRPEARWLSTLAAQPVGLTADEMLTEFLDILEHLRDRARRQRIRELLAQGDALGAAGRAELSQLLAEKA